MKKKGLKCSINYCQKYMNSPGVRSDDFILHRFPTNIQQLHGWIHFVQESNKTNDWKPLVHNRICSDHFEKSCYEQNRADNKKKLKYFAIPSISTENGVIPSSYVTGDCSIESVNIGEENSNNDDTMNPTPCNDDAPVSTKELTSENMSETGIDSSETFSKNLLNILECSTCKKQYSTAAAREKHKCPWCSNCQRLYSTYQKYQQHKHKCLQKNKGKVYDSNSDSLYNKLFSNEDKPNRKSGACKIPKKLSQTKNFESTANMLKALGTDIRPIENKNFSLPFTSSEDHPSHQNLLQLLMWRQMMTMMVPDGVSNNTEGFDIARTMSSLNMPTDCSPSPNASKTDTSEDDATPDVLDRLKMYLLLREKIDQLKDSEESDGSEFTHFLDVENKQSLDLSSLLCQGSGSSISDENLQANKKMKMT